MCFLGSFRIVVSVTQVDFYVNYSFFSDLEMLILDSKAELTPWFCCVITEGTDHTTKDSVMLQLLPDPRGSNTRHKQSLWGWEPWSQAISTARATCLPHPPDSLHC